MHGGPQPSKRAAEQPGSRAAGQPVIRAAQVYFPVTL
ncbi:hypothetical protein CFAEC_00590 [Corynebacterium faecale]|nr:hypothetical protein CFAEC_00590 [Corynebacterium faecale]